MAGGDAQMTGAGANGIVKRSLEDLKASRPAQQLGRKVLGLLERWSLDEQPLGGEVGSIMTRSVATCSGNDTLHRAAQIMWDRDCGAVPVVDSEGRAVGLVTDRDLCMAAYTRGRPLAAISVSSLLSGQLYTCSAATSLDDAVSRMRAHRVRRLVVVDPRDQRLVGMLALADLARHLSALSATRRDAALALAALLAVLSERRLGTPEFPPGSRPSTDRAAE
jgi:CBS domain-containing protein